MFQPIIAHPMPNRHVFLWTLADTPSHPLFEALCVRLDYSSHHSCGASDAELVFTSPSAWIGRDLRALHGSQHIFILPKSSALEAQQIEAYELMARLYTYLLDEGQAVIVWDSEAAAAQPEPHLRHLCIALNIPFAWRMLDGFDRLDRRDAMPHATLMSLDTEWEDSLQARCTELMEPLYWQALADTPAPTFSPEPMLAMTA